VGYFDDVKKADPPPTSGRLTVVTSSSGTSSYAAAALRGEAGDVASAPEGARNDRLNKAWFNMGRHIGAGSIDVESVKIALTQAGQAAGLPDHEIETVLRDGSTSALNAGAANPRIPAPLPDLPTPTVFEVPDLSSTEEAAFWSARDILTHVHTFARARMVAPWAVLGVTLARIITATPHQVCLPPIVGGKASLNLFVGLVGPSGSGKGAAEAVAAEAVNVGYIESHNVGSGEGIAHGYKHRSKGELHWNDDHHAVMFSVPEIDSLAAQGDRKGATLMPQLRSGWTGEQLGFGYADPMKRIIVEAHQYRLCARRRYPASTRRLPSRRRRRRHPAAVPVDARDRRRCTRPGASGASTTHMAGAVSLGPSGHRRHQDRRLPRRTHRHQGEPPGTQPR
jgi:hypothetical protein